MTRYNSSIFHKDQLSLFHEATMFVDRLEKVPGLYDYVRCYELTRAVAKLLKLDSRCVQDGKYAQVDHSWIILDQERKEDRRPAILDVFARSRLPQVQLVDYYALLQHHPLYRPSEFFRMSVDELVVDLLVTAMDGSLTAEAKEMEDIWSDPLLSNAKKVEQSVKLLTKKFGKT